MSEPSEEIPTYRRLHESTKIGPLPLKAWAVMLGCLLIAWAWVKWGPLPTGPALSLAVTVLSFPVVVVSLSGGHAVSPVRAMFSMLASAFRRRRARLPDRARGGIVVEEVPPMLVQPVERPPAWDGAELARPIEHAAEDEESPAS